MWCLVIFKQCLKGFVSKPEPEYAPAWLAPSGLLVHTYEMTGQQVDQSAPAIVDILFDSPFHSKLHWYTNQTIDSSAKWSVNHALGFHVKFSNSELAVIFYVRSAKHLMPRDELRRARILASTSRKQDALQRLWKSNTIFGSQLNNWKIHNSSKSDVILDQRPKGFVTYQSNINLFDCICYHLYAFLTSDKIISYLTRRN